MSQYWRAYNPTKGVNRRYFRVSNYFLALSPGLQKAILTTVAQVSLTDLLMIREVSQRVRTFIDRNPSILSQISHEFSSCKQIEEFLLDYSLSRYSLPNIPYTNFKIACFYKRRAGTPPVPHPLDNDITIPFHPALQILTRLFASRIRCLSVDTLNISTFFAEEAFYTALKSLTSLCVAFIDESKAPSSAVIRCSGIDRHRLIRYRCPPIKSFENLTSLSITHWIFPEGKAYALNLLRLMESSRVLERISLPLMNGDIEFIQPYMSLLRARGKTTSTDFRFDCFHILHRREYFTDKERSTLIPFLELILDLASQVRLFFVNMSFLEAVKSVRVGLLNGLLITLESVLEVEERYSALIPFYEPDDNHNCAVSNLESVTMDAPKRLKSSSFPFFIPPLVRCLAITNFDMRMEGPTDWPLFLTTVHLHGIGNEERSWTALLVRMAERCVNLRSLSLFIEAAERQPNENPPPFFLSSLKDFPNLLDLKLELHSSYVDTDFCDEFPIEEVLINLRLRRLELAFTFKRMREQETVLNIFAYRLLSLLRLETTLKDTLLHFTVALQSSNRSLYNAVTRIQRKVVENRRNASLRAIMLASERPFGFIEAYTSSWVTFKYDSTNFDGF